MSTIDMRCRRCEAPMQLGFIIDGAQNNDGAGPDTWVEGHPSATKFLGMRLGSIRTQGHAAYTVTAYRCPQCNGLELFAPTNDTYLHPASNE